MVMTLVFPDTLSNMSPRTAPLGTEVLKSNHSSIEQLPTTWNALSPISQDTTLAFAVPSAEASEFLSSIQELPNISTLGKEKRSPEALGHETKSWVMRTAQRSKQPVQGTIRRAAVDFWTGFVDLIKVRHEI